ncbi:MAG TPA: hypothetical protein VMM92_14325 [Thermoanaerobaculia bacterium]|nr:hypothetical protein [Thermoanaerobaculia bacterium]
MFDLEKEVAAWSEAVHAGRCGHAGEVAELSDHLYCEIDRARATGLSDEQAFAAAVAKLGSRPELAAEHAKNRSLLQAGCAALLNGERSLARGERRLLIAHGLLWAALMLVYSLVSVKLEVPRTSGWLLSCVLIPGWFASELLLRRALRMKPRSGG